MGWRASVGGVFMMITESFLAKTLHFEGRSGFRLGHGSYEEMAFVLKSASEVMVLGQLSPGLAKER